MAFEDITDALYTTSEKTQAYINHTAEYHKLRLFKSTMKFTSKMVNGLILGTIITLALLFLLIGIALWINEMMENSFIGFFILGGSLLLLFVATFFFAKKQITKMLLQSFSSLLNDENQDKSIAQHKSNEEVL